MKLMSELIAREEGTKHAIKICFWIGLVLCLLVGNECYKAGQENVRAEIQAERDLASLKPGGIFGW